MVTLRAADAGDSRLLWEWRNHPQSRAASIDTAPVPWEDHERWYAATLRNPNRLILMAVDEQSEALGMVRFDFDGEGRATVSINIASRWRGLGLGQVILHEGLEAARASRDGVSFTAQIRTENAASIRIFEREGFVPEFEHEGVLTLRG